MKVKGLVAALLALPGIGAAYMAWLLWRANEDGRWFYIVIAAFLLVLSVAALLPAGKRPEQAKKVAATRFAGALVLPIYLLVFGGLLLLAALVGFFHHRAR